MAEASKSYANMSAGEREGLGAGLGLLLNSALEVGVDAAFENAGKYAALAATARRWQHFTEAKAFSAWKDNVAEMLAARAEAEEVAAAAAAGFGDDASQGSGEFNEDFGSMQMDRVARTKTMAKTMAAAPMAAAPMAMAPVGPGSAAGSEEDDGFGAPSAASFGDAPAPLSAAEDFEAPRKGPVTDQLEAAPAAALDEALLDEAPVRQKLEQAAAARDEADAPPQFARRRKSKGPAPAAAAAPLAAAPPSPDAASDDGGESPQGGDMY
eukprot:SAG22_NODE_3609_length_1618_cov_1.111257_1_plen_268_part_00